MSVSLRCVGISSRTVCGPTDSLVRIWAAECDSATDFSSLATFTTGIGFARIGGITAVHLRGPATRATPLTCSADSEFFGVDFRLGTYLPTFPPAGLADFRDAVLPILPSGRILLDGRAWEMPTPDNLDVFVDRLRRAGLLIFDPLVEESAARHHAAGTDGADPVRPGGRVCPGASCRRSNGLATAARMLRAGVSIADVVYRAGYHDQPHLTRSLRTVIGHTPGEVSRGSVFLDL